MAQKYVLLKETPTGRLMGINPERVCFVGAIDETRTMLVFGRNSEVTQQESLAEMILKLEAASAHATSGIA